MNGKNDKKDVSGFSVPVGLDRIMGSGYSLSPSLYTRKTITHSDEDIDFMKEFNNLKAQFEALCKEGQKVDAEIIKNLRKLGFEVDI